LSIILLEKLIVAQWAKKFRAICGIRRLISVFTRVCEAVDTQSLNNQRNKRDPAINIDRSVCLVCTFVVIFRVRDWSHMKQNRAVVSVEKSCIYVTV